MRIPSRQHLTAILLTLVLGVAVLLSGFAHKMPAAQDTALASFVMAGGDLADICNDSGKTHQMPGGCDACRLVGAAVLAEPVLCPVAVERVIAATILIPAQTHAARAPRDPALGGRAPPLA